MSRTTVLEVTEKSTTPIAELHNAWGSAPVIWDYLARRFLELDNWMLTKGEDRKLWALAYDPKVTDHLRVLLLLTFDGAIIRKANFIRAANDIRAACAIMKIGKNLVNHWPAIADIFEKSDAEAIGLWCTSVSDNPFVVYDEDVDEEDEPCRKIRINFEVYEEMALGNDHD